MHALPEKLEIDAIAEVVFSIRLEHNEANIIPELIIGKLAENPDWINFAKIRLPISDIPVHIRSQDPSLKFEPIIELKDSIDNVTIRIGHNIVSYHIFEPYIGWERLNKTLKKILQYIFDNIKNCTADRISLRYVNIFTKEKHKIHNVTELNLNLEIENNTINEPQMISFLHKDNDYKNCTALIRIASSQFIADQAQRKIDALIDIEIFSPKQFSTNKCSEVIGWLDKAHSFEKKQFFRLLAPDTIKHMKGE